MISILVLFMYAHELQSSNYIYNYSTYNLLFMYLTHLIRTKVLLNAYC